MKLTPASSTARHAGVIAICGNPNSGKTTIFNALTGLNQKVGNYPGVTVEKVSGYFSPSRKDSRRFEVIDIPGTYSLAAFSPDEYIAASALYGGIGITHRPDALICVVDATNLERGLYLLLQVLEVGIPVVVALNMIDVARRRRTTTDIEGLTKALGGVPVIPVVASRGQGIDQLKAAAIDQIGQPAPSRSCEYGEETEQIMAALAAADGAGDHTRAELLRVVFDVEGPAEMKFLADLVECGGDRPEAQQMLHEGRQRIKSARGVLSGAETTVLTTRAMEIGDEVVTRRGAARLTRSERIDRVLLHPVLGPILLVLMMTFVFQSIFSWAEPFMDFIDRSFGSLAHLVSAGMSEGPLESLLTDGIIGGVGSVLVFLPQIIILFLFIAVLEDSGYMSRAAFLVDRMFRWCGLSGKSFIPMLSSFACAIPGILATRTIEDRKLRFITIMVAPLMTCSARLPVYAIMIAAFVPHESYFGLFNLQGLTLTALYLLGIVAAVLVSFVLQKTIFKTEQGTFMMEMPSYKVPTVRSVVVRVANRAKAFIIRAGTVIFAITIIIWALAYFPHSGELAERYEAEKAELQDRHARDSAASDERLRLALVDLPEDLRVRVERLRTQLELSLTDNDIRGVIGPEQAEASLPEGIIDGLAGRRARALRLDRDLAYLGNTYAGAGIRDSYLGRMGRAVEPVFRPLGWDWRISMSVLASFPAREVIIATLGTIYNLGAEVDQESTTLVEKMRQARWESGPKQGQRVFSTAVALSIMVFFALCCQCGATLVTIRQETGRWLYSIAVFVYMTVLAYVSALVVYQTLDYWWS